MAASGPASEFLEDWDRFCDALKRAGRVAVRSETPADELTAAEGFRHLVRMLRAGFEITCEYGDLEHPVLFPMASETLLSEGVTPDARYLQAFVDGNATHRITGTRGTAPLIEFGVYTGRTGVHPTTDLVGFLTEETLEVNADGGLEVVLSPDEHPGNWIRTDGDVRYLFIRQYAHDWSQTRAADLRLSRQGAAAEKSPLDLATLRRGLEGTAHFIATAPPFWAAVSDYWAGYAVNRIVPQDEADSQTDITVPSGHRFACGWYQLAPDQALVVEFAPASVPYWGLGLTNYWYEAIGWAEGGSGINDHSAHYERDGTVRVRIGDRPDTLPSGVNWLDTRGHRQGTMVFRWSRSTHPLPVFESRVVKLAELMGSG